VSRRWAGAEQVRILPALPMRLCLADHRYAMLPLQTDPSAIEAAVVVDESALLDALVTLVEGLWQRALPLPGPSMPGATITPHRNSEIDEQRLLALLLSGLTDTAIARQLGVAADRRRADRVIVPSDVQVRGQLPHVGRQPRPAEPFLAAALVQCVEERLDVKRRAGRRCAARVPSEADMPGQSLAAHRHARNGGLLISPVEPASGVM
jgi:hypothetical protein